MKYKSFAQWPQGTIGTDGDVSDDSHETLEQADAVCARLRREGFGGERKVFPVRTWVESITHPNAFDEWWYRRGQFIDPDTSDVPWHDKRRALAEAAFDAAMAQSMNYTADDEVHPSEVTFANGRKVAMGCDTDYIHLIVK